MSQILVRELRKQLLSARSVVAQTTCAYNMMERIGNREVVGYGMNGDPGYVDNCAFPMQAIRFREIKGDLVALREKEKGDWKKLTIDEKKTLYRASFCQTYAEMDMPSGEWKLMMAAGFFCIWITLWYHVWMLKYVYNELPSTFTEESQREQVKRMIDQRMNPIEGIASYWDYEKNRWKD